MKILGIETSGGVGSAAVLSDDAVISEKVFEKGMLHGKELLPSIKEIFDEQGLKPSDIDLIAVDAGPGSYTGIRVGVACAKTLAYTLRKPVIDVAGLDAIAQNVEANHKYACPIIDAKRKMVYACIYECAQTNDAAHNIAEPDQTLSDRSRIEIKPWNRKSDLLIIAPETLVDKLPPGAFVFGDGIARHKDVFEKTGLTFGNDELATPKASVIAMLGKQKFENGASIDLNGLQPIYLRLPEPVEKKNSSPDK